MTHSRITRRGVVALIAAGLAGCTGSEERENDDSVDDPNGDGDDGTDDPTDDSRDAPQRDVDVDWDEAPAFRRWLLETDVTSRFDYTAAFPDGVDPAEEFPAFFGMSAGDVDAHLIQTGTHVFFGSFDVESIVDGVAATDDVEMRGQYEGYTILAEELSNGSARDIAVGSDAIVVGNDAERRIDASRGDEDRLEEVDPEFTHLFDELPHETTVTGQYGGVTHLDVDGIHCWGVSSESPSAETMTWVIIFERESDLTDAVAADLEEISGEVDESSYDGRTATIRGRPPEIPEGAP
ncbi:hypothetical protein [Natrarchaeobius chitinivorans]|uniref:Uncharacterized protein n=1 Tax=Natrarchaeobius chitinivorans TaxID=1679083 RepID=A0A3N6N1H0_NATCH|nr:hypothetical protein [Natrarchaeobius chitinivorans]RQG91832.1 hypothetical protein EA473_18755 [Natrarchaeobius chitinivorans]